MKKTVKTTAKKKKNIDPKKLDEKIRKRAHEIYLSRDDEEGDALSDWLQAEKEIKKKS